MPNPVHHLVTFRGHFGTQTTVRETWSFGLRFSPSNISVDAAVAAPLGQGLLNALRDRYALLHGNSNMKISNQAWFDECRAYRIGEDGRSTDEPTIARMSTPQVGAATTNLLPWQTTMAVTLDAGFPSKGRFGRFYLPTICTPVEDTGLIALAPAELMKTAIVTALSDMSNLPGPDVGFGLVVVGSTGEGGSMRPVESVRLGRVIDTQRRRRRQVQEAYISSSFSA